MTARARCARGRLGGGAVGRRSQSRLRSTRARRTYAHCTYVHCTYVHWQQPQPDAACRAPRAALGECGVAPLCVPQHDARGPLRPARRQRQGNGSSVSVKGVTAERREAARAGVHGSGAAAGLRADRLGNASSGYHLLLGRPPLPTSSTKKAPVAAGEVGGATGTLEPFGCAHRIARPGEHVEGVSEPHAARPRRPGAAPRRPAPGAARRRPSPRVLLLCQIRMRHTRERPRGPRRPALGPPAPAVSAARPERGRGAAAGGAVRGRAEPGGGARSGLGRGVST